MIHASVAGHAAAATNPYGLIGPLPVMHFAGIGVCVYLVIAAMVFAHCLDEYRISTSAVFGFFAGWFAMSITYGLGIVFAGGQFLEFPIIYAGVTLASAIAAVGIGAIRGLESIERVFHV